MRVIFSRITDGVIDRRTDRQMDERKYVNTVGSFRSIIVVIIVIFQVVFILVLFPLLQRGVTVKVLRQGFVTPCKMNAMTQLSAAGHQTQCCQAHFGLPHHHSHSQIRLCMQYAVVQFAWKCAWTARPRYREDSLLIKRDAQLCM